MLVGTARFAQNLSLRALVELHSCFYRGVMGKCGKEKPSVCRKQPWDSGWVLDFQWNIYQLVTFQRGRIKLCAPVLGPAGLIFQLPFRFPRVQELKYKPVLFLFCSQEECWWLLCSHSNLQNPNHELVFWVVATQISLIFTLVTLVGEDSHFDQYFSDGLVQPNQPRSSAHKRTHAWCTGKWMAAASETLWTDAWLVSWVGWRPQVCWL